MLLIVDINGQPYLVDVGFGGSTPTAPLRLKADIEQDTPHGRYRLIGGYPKWTLENEIGGQWQRLYEFTLTSRSLDDYIAMNDGTMASFRDDLRVARIDGPKRVNLWNTRLNTHENGETTTRMLTNLLEIRDVLTNVFGIQLPATDRLDRSNCVALELALVAASVMRSLLCATD